MLACYKFYEGQNSFKNKFLKNAKICTIVIDYLVRQNFPGKICFSDIVLI